MRPAVPCIEKRSGRRRGRRHPPEGDLEGPGSLRRNLPDLGPGSRRRLEDRLGHHVAYFRGGTLELTELLVPSELTLPDARLHRAPALGGRGLREAEADHRPNFLQLPLTVQVRIRLDEQI